MLLHIQTVYGEILLGGERTFQDAVETWVSGLQLPVSVCEHENPK